jgi:hypothetical protein
MADRLTPVEWWRVAQLIRRVSTHDHEEQRLLLAAVAQIEADAVARHPVDI